MTGARIVIETLIEQGVETVFGFPGGMVLNIYDELYKHSDRITHYITSHEQGAAHAADGYARTTGKPGVVIATSGPGATNLVTGIANAYLDSSPLVAITGNVPTTLLGRDSFQEVDVLGITMPITKHNYIVKDVTELADTIREAFQIAISGRPGPVLIDIPKDVQQSECDYVAQAPVEKFPYITASKEALQAVAELIMSSERPFIYAGGGVLLSGASQELLHFAKKIDAPIGTSMMGLSSVPNDYPGFLGMTGMHGQYASTKAMSESDLLIAIGSRFSDRATGNKAEFAKNSKILHLDIDPAEIGKNIPTYTGLSGNIKTLLTDLIAAISQQEHKLWHERVAYLKNHSDNESNMSTCDVTPLAIINTVRSMMPDDGPVATDVGQHQMWIAQYYKFMQPRTHITSGGLGTMGFGMGAAIGSCIGTGRKKTVLFTGDGSFHMNLNELATAVSNDLPLVIVVMNNQVLGMVRQWQTLFFGKRYSQTSLSRKTDFVKLAEAFGAKGYRIGAHDDMKAIFEEVFAQKGPVLVDCEIGCDEMVYPMIPPGGSIHNIILK